MMFRIASIIANRLRCDKVTRSHFCNEFAREGLRVRNLKPEETDFLSPKPLAPPVHLFLQHADVWQVAVFLGVIQAVANRKFVGNVEAEIIDRHF